MADELQRLEDWVAPLLARLSPAESRRLALAMARELRAQQQRTMAAQTAPDGSAWQPRKPPARDARGGIRRAAQHGRLRAAMFTGLRRNKWLKASATASEASSRSPTCCATCASARHTTMAITPASPL